MKALYLRITELYKKWNSRPVLNWAHVRNQLSMDDKLQMRINKYKIKEKKHYEIRQKSKTRSQGIPDTTT